MEEQPLGSNYRLIGELGKGRMGRVYLGKHVDGREFAVKKLRSDLSDEPGIIQRFHQEWNILKKLKGPNLVQVHDLVVESETVAFVMDLVPGGDLRQVLEATGRLLPSEVARIGAGIAKALAAAHAQGIVHGDVKPENVLMDSRTAERVPKLTDFGIATVVATAGTRTGTSQVGTAQYMAPETIAGQPASPSVDVYALGVVLYELSCGVTPFASPSMPQTMMGHAQLLPGKPPGITEELWAVVAQLLSKNPLVRPDAAVVATRLDELTSILHKAPVADHLSVPPPGRPMGNDAETLLPGAFPVPAPTPAKGSLMRKLRVAGTVVVVAAVAATGAYLFASGGKGDPASADKPDGPGGSTGTSQSITTRSTTSVTSTRVTQLSEMPDLVGKLLGAARDELPTTLDLAVEETFDNSKPDGTVVKQDPAPGGAVGKKVTLTVARPAFTTYLDALVPAAGRWTNDTGEIVGMKDKSYSHSVFARVDGCSSKSSVEYNLNQGYRRFTATAGMANDSGSSSLQVQFEVYADEGRILKTATVKLGEVVDLDLDVTKVLRLKIQWQPIRDRDSCYSNANAWVLGDAKLLGIAGEVPTSGLPPTSTRGSVTTATTTATR